MAEVELIPYKDYLICPTPVFTQKAPGSKEYWWRDGYFLYTRDKKILKNRPGGSNFPTKETARASAIAESKKLVDAGL